MLLVWLFWLLFLLPGLCVRGLLRPATEQDSAFEALAVGYVFSFALTLPVVVVGYWVRLPLSVLCVYLAALIVAAIVRLTLSAVATRPRWSMAPSSLATGAALMVLLGYSAVLGGHLAHDADFHLARIRFLYDHGLSNADPFTWTGFTHPYHTNAQHALIAAGAKLTGLDPIEVWLASEPWAKLVSGAGVGALCARLGGNRLAVNVAVLWYIGSNVRLDWAIYPNQLAPIWLVPVGLAACIELVASERQRYPLLLLTASSLVLAVTHGLYAGFLAVLGASCLALPLLQRCWTERRRALRPVLKLGLLAALAMASAAPFLYVARSTHTPRQDNFDYAGGPPVPHVQRADRWTKSLRSDAHGRLRLPLRGLLGGPTSQLLSLGALIALYVRGRRKEALGIAGVALTGVLLLSVPPLAERVTAGLGAAWMLERLVPVLDLLPIALVPAAIAVWEPPWPWLRTRWATRSAALVPLLVAAWTSYHGIELAERVKLERIITVRVEQMSAHTLVRPDLPESMLQDQKLLRMIPAGSVVLTHPMAARQLRKLYDLRFIRSWRNHTGVDDLLDRTVAMSALMYPSRITPKIRSILAHYDVRYAVQKKDHAIRWLKTQEVLAVNPRLTLYRLERD